jgi:hypothetical protein
MVDRLTREQAALIGAYTAVLCGPISDVHELVERVMGRPVWTHEMGDPHFMEEVRKAVQPQFLSICAALKEEK